MITEITTVPEPTPAQVDYARKISQRLNEVISQEDYRDRRALSDWIGAHQAAFKRAVHQKSSSFGATSRQVAYAERLARRRRRDVPNECFKDAGLMSKWIEHNK